MKMKWSYLTPVALAFGLSPLAEAASFDCAAAGSEVEQFICHDEKLSALDEEMAAAYSTALRASRSRHQLQSQQRTWLRLIRNRVVGDRYSMAAEYKERIKQLGAVAPLFAEITETTKCAREGIDQDLGDDRAQALNLELIKGKPVEFRWRASIAATTDDVRPGFSISAFVDLSEMTPVIESGFIALQSKPLTDSLATKLRPGNCDVIITRQGDELRVRSLGCARRGNDASLFDYTFHQQETSPCVFIRANLENFIVPPDMK
jgi:uncharacterized protein